MEKHFYRIWLEGGIRGQVFGGGGGTGLGQFIFKVVLVGFNNDG